MSIRKFASTVLASMLLVTFFLSAGALAQSAPKKYFSTVSTNSTLVLGARSFLNGGVIVNTTATVYYFKLYNKATAPTCGTDVPVWTLPLPANIATPVPITAQGLQFGTGMGFCIVGGIADADTSPAAVGIAVNLAVSGSVH